MSADTPKRRDRRAAFAKLSEGISNVGIRNDDGSPLSAAEAEEQAAALTEASDQAQSASTEALKEVANDAAHDLENVMPSTPEILGSAAGNAPVPNDSDGMARTGPDGKPAEGNDDLNSLKLVGEVEEIPLDELMEEITDLIGMNPFKDWISDLSEGKGFNELAELMGFNDPNSELSIRLAEEGKGSAKKKENSVFYHMVLTGNPGTGKSTVAEKYCHYLRSSGLMPGAKFYKISAGDIVSQFIGATANELKKILRQGKDTNTPLILHLDEAYSLTSNKHGEEALTELVNAMTEEADRIVLVLSGYEDPMMEMLDKNEGMRSRVRIELSCPDYNDNELLEIMKTKLSGQSIERTLSKDAQDLVKQVFSAIRDKMGDKFGNGRVAEVLLQDMQLAQEKRISKRYSKLTNEEKLARKDEIIKEMTTYNINDVTGSAAYRSAFPNGHSPTLKGVPSNDLTPK